jgi:phage terminase large subunit
MAEKIIRATLLPKPRELLQSKAFIKILYGGRGGAKSYSIAQILVSKALASPIKILCVRETQNSIIDSSLGVIKTVINDMGLQDMFKDTKYTLKCLNGSEFLFRGMQQPHRIKSLENIAIAWVEEADSLSAESWGILLPTIRKEDAEIWVSFNPDTVDDFIYKEFILRDNDLVEKRHINYDDNPFLSDTLLRQIEYMKSTEYEKYLHVYKGEPRVQNDAQIFKDYKIISYNAYLELNEGTLSDEAKAALPTQNEPKNGIYYLGCDWGFAADPTAMVRCFITEDNDLVIDKEVYQYGVEIDKLPSLLQGIDGWETAIIRGDSARPDTISYINNRINGVNTVHKAKKGAGSVIEGIEYIKSFRHIYVTSNCPNLIDELKLYSYIKDKRTGVITNTPEDKNNHAIDALRYCLSKAESNISARIVFDSKIDKIMM